MGSFLLLFLFAALNVALGWATANWIARRQRLSSELLEPVEPEPRDQSLPAVESTPDVNPPNESPAVVKEVQPSAEAEPADEEPSQQLAVPESYDGPKEEIGQLGYSEVIDRVAEECQMTKAISGVLKLEIEQFRSALLTAEDVYRTADAEDDDDALAQAFEEVKSAIDGWMPDQAAACEQMEAAKSKHDIFTALGLPIDDILRLATGRLESRCQRMQAEENATSENAGKVRREIVGLIDACHDLRDAIQIGFASVLKTNQKFQCGEGLQIDDVTGLANYAGLEAAIAKWWSSEDRQGDAASLIAIDADGMAQLNQQMGTVQSDQLLREIGITLRHGLRQERGFDVPARIGGQRFAALVGYTTPRQAASALERIRQVIDATQFSGDGETCKVRVSCAITGLQKNISLDKHIGLLVETLEFAKERGGNCTAIWQDNEIIHVDAIEYDVEAKTVTLNAETPKQSTAAALSAEVESDEIVSSSAVDSPAESNEADASVELAEESTEAGPTEESEAATVGEATNTNADAELNNEETEELTHDADSPVGEIQDQTIPEQAGEAAEADGEHSADDASAAAPSSEPESAVLDEIADLKEEIENSVHPDAGAGEQLAAADDVSPTPSEVVEDMPAEPIASDLEETSQPESGGADEISIEETGGAEDERVIAAEPTESEVAEGEAQTASR